MRPRETAHPTDAIRVYEREVESLLDRKQNETYREAVDLIGRIRTLMTRDGQASEFAGYLLSLRATHRRKRNFLALLAAAKL